MNPFFLNDSGQQIFTIYYEPDESVNNNTAVILCYPVGQEYIRSHRTFLRLAESIASEGFHVLRFDYYGCGDSSGDFQSAAISQWVENINSVINEIKKDSSVKNIYLVGLRLGATLAYYAAIENPLVHSLLLWSPVIRGDDYINEITEDHNNWLTGSFCEDKKDLNSAYLTDISGFAYSDDLINSIRNIDLARSKIINKKVPNLIVLEKDQSDRKGSVYGNIAQNTLNFVVKKSDYTPFWKKKQDENDKTLVSFKTIEEIVDIFCTINHD